MKWILTMTALLAVAGCGGEDLEWLATAADDIALAESAPTAVDAPATNPGPTNLTPAVDVADAAVIDTPAVEQAAPAAERRIVFVDVRRQDEFTAGHVTGAILIPYTELGERWSELEDYRDADIVLYCRTGRRSGIAQEILMEAGFEHLYNGGAIAELERLGVPITR